MIGIFRMKIYFIRHGQTKGNLEKRYVGRTDEVLCRKAAEDLKKYTLPIVNKIYASPMKRCIETAQILYPNQTIEIAEDFRECDFGEFEYKNYEDLKENTAYQTFIDSMGESGFPQGEDIKSFKVRCQKTFYDVINHCQPEENIAFVVHGGTIMSIMEKFAVPHKDYYSWQIGNGQGYVAEVAWEESKMMIMKVENICRKEF